MKMLNYKQGLIERFWEYQKEHFLSWERYLEGPNKHDGRPPVFRKQAEHFNVIINTGIPAVKQRELLDEIPAIKRHKWFRSMRSSQALTLSIFGNLKVHNRLGYLSELSDESNKPLFGDEDFAPEKFKIEYSVDFLGEPHPTSVDCLITGGYRVAIECKLSEDDVGSCSRPNLKMEATNYETESCNGLYTHQRGRKQRCSLTEIGVLYWKYIPKLFPWPNDVDLEPCPLNKNYQLVRNILAACVSPNSTLSETEGHAVLIYDERNPAFQEGGKGFNAFEETRAALKNTDLLRKCSWQRIVTHLRKKDDLSWLTEELESKYAL